MNAEWKKTRSSRHTGGAGILKTCILAAVLLLCTGMAKAQTWNIGSPVASSVTAVLTAAGGGNNGGGGGGNGNNGGTTSVSTQSSMRFSPSEEIPLSPSGVSHSLNPVVMACLTRHLQ